MNLPRCLRPFVCLQSAIAICRGSEIEGGRRREGEEGGREGGEEGRREREREAEEREREREAD